MGGRVAEEMVFGAENVTSGMCSVCVRACVRACVCMHVCVCACACSVLHNTNTIVIQATTHM